MIARRKRGAADLYQVDFVAALFGGFLLIWLAQMTQADSAANKASAASPFSLEVWIDHGGSPSSRVNVVPDDSLRCANMALLDDDENHQLAVSPCAISENLIPMNSRVHEDLSIMSLADCWPRKKCSDSIRTLQRSFWDDFLGDLIHGMNAPMAGCPLSAKNPDCYFLDRVAETYKLFSVRMSFPEQGASKPVPMLLGIAIAGSLEAPSGRVGSTRLVALGSTTSDEPPSSIVVDLRRGAHVVIAWVKEPPSPEKPNATLQVYRFDEDELGRFSDEGTATLSLSVEIRSEVWGRRCARGSSPIAGSAASEVTVELIGTC